MGQDLERKTPLGGGETADQSVLETLVHGVVVRRCVGQDVSHRLEGSRQEGGDEIISPETGIQDIAATELCLGLPGHTTSLAPPARTPSA